MMNAGTVSVALVLKDNGLQNQISSIAKGMESTFATTMNNISDSFSTFTEVVKTTETAIKAYDVANKIASSGVVTSIVEAVRYTTTLAAMSGAKGIFTIATTAATAALKALWATLIANPIGLILIAIAAVIAAFTFWSNAKKKAAEEEKAVAKAVDEVRQATEQQTSKLRDNLQQLEASGKGNTALAESYRKSIADIEAQGRSIEDTIKTHKLTGDAVDALKKKQEEYANAVNARMDLEKELDGLARGMVDTQLAVMDAEDKVAEKKKALNEAIEQYGEGSREAQRATLELESAENQLADAQDQLTANTERLANSEQELTAAHLEEVAAQAGLQLETAKTTGNYDDLNDTLAALAEDGSESSMKLRDQIIEDAKEQGLVWDEQSGKMMTKSEKTWNDIKRFASDAWEAIKNVFSVIGGWFGDRWNDIKNVFSEVTNWFRTKFSEAWTAIQNIFSVVRSWFGERWNDIKNVFNEVTSWFRTKFSEAWEAIKNVFSSVGSFFGGIWNTIKAQFSTIGSKIGNAIGGAFKSVVNSIIGFAEGKINGFIRAINGAIRIINKIPGVSVSTISEMSIPKLAQGGYVGRNQPQLAIIGDNTREGEIVAPESKIYEQVAKALQHANLSSGNGNQSIDLRLKLEYPDGKHLIKEINSAQIRDGYVSLLT